MTALPVPDYTELFASRFITAPAAFVGLDFDGTLAAITSDPRDAVLSGGMRELLRRMASVPGLTVAIISGRALQDLQTRVNLPELVYVGNHGLEFGGERLHGWRPMVSQMSLLELRTVLTRLQTELGAIDGIYIEDKTLTGSIHYRRVSVERHEEVKRVVAGVVRKSRTLCARAGKLVWELRPRFSWNKGMAFRTMLSHFHIPQAASVYIGDDTTDEDVFMAAPCAQTLRVGDCTRTAARFCIPSQKEVEPLLARLLDLRLGQRQVQPAAAAL